MRVREFRCNIEPEVDRPLNFLVAKTENEPSALFHIGLIQHGAERGIQRLLNVLQQHWRSKLDCIFQRAQEIVLLQIDYLEPFWAFCILYPLYCFYVCLENC